MSTKTVLLAAFVFAVSFVLGLLRFSFVETSPPPEFLTLVGQKVTYEGIVADDPDQRDTHQRVVVETEGVKILVVANRFPKVRYGDRVRASGTLSLPEPFDTDTGRVFSYDKYLAKDGIYFLLEFSTIETIEANHAFSFFGILYRLKNAFNEALTRALPEPSASLASGLILGGKQGLGEDLKQAFTVAGLIHIVVLSGYNVMIVAVAVLSLLRFLPRRVSALLAALTIGLFVLLAGAGAASVRAGLMAGVGLYARATARTFDALRALTFVAFLMVLWNPLILLYDPGFQLSCIATLGLIIGAPLVARYLAFVKSEFLREIVASTVAAQVAVLPLLLYQSGLFSLVALLANLLILPLVPLTMAFSFVAGLLSLIAPTVALFAGLPAYVVLTYIMSVATGAAALPLAAVKLPAFSFIFVLLAYALLAYIVRRLQQSMPLPTGERVVLRTFAN